MLCPGDTPLHSAIRSFERKIKHIKILLKRHGRRDINVRNSEGETPLLLAVQNEKCSPELIEFLLAHGADAKAKTPRDGNSALHWLAMGYMDEMECRRVGPMLLRRGNDINARNSEGCTPLHLAAQSNHPLVGVLLEHESDVCMRNFNGETSLHLYLQNKTSDFAHIRSFLKNTRDVNDVNFKGETPLHVAVQNERCTKELIYLLLKHGADVTATTPRDGNTALHWLAIHSCINVDDDDVDDDDSDCYEIASLLLECGSDPNARNLEGCIPLHYAACTGIRHQTLVSILLTHKSDVCARNFKGDTPFHLYLQNPLLIHLTAKVFLNKFLDANVANSKGETLLHVLVRSKRMISVWLIINLLSRGADVSVEDAMGENVYQAYCRAMKNRHHTANPTLQMILQGKKYANSSLHVACLFHDVDSVHRLLRLGVDANAVGTFVYSPLLYAYFATGDSDKRLTTIKLLLDFGADIDHPIDVDDVHDSLSLNPNNMRMVVSILALPVLGFGHHHLLLEAVPNDRLLNVLFQHRAKLLTLQEKQIERGINVEVPIQTLHNLHLIQPLDFYGVQGYTNWLSLCSEELKTMSDTVIGESRVSFLDLLLADAKETAIHAKNKELVKAFLAKKAMFPMYRGMLDAKLDKALERQKLIESAAVSLSTALIFGDPSDEFFVRTLSYCSNQDLMSVIEALDEKEPRQECHQAASGVSFCRQKEATEELDASEAALAAEPKSSNPFDNMPKGTFDFDDFKRFYRDEDDGKSIPYFFQKFDPQNCSIWFCEYKFPDELKRVIRSCDLIDGMYRRLDKMRKAAFASVCLFGTKNDITISGIWIWRGQELAFALCPDWQTDYESYSWTKLKPSDERTKKLVKQYLSWTGTDKDGRAFNQGRIFI